MLDLFSNIIYNVYINTSKGERIGKVQNIDNYKKENLKIKFSKP